MKWRKLQLRPLHTQLLKNQKDKDSLLKPKLKHKKKKKRPKKLPNKPNKKDLKLKKRKEH